MDMEITLICMALVVGAAAVSLVMAMLGTRRQSYEEVMAETRRLAHEHSQLGDAERKRRQQQQQTKKNKKAGKKEKQQAREQAAASSDPESETSPEGGDDERAVHQRGHVDFQEPSAAPEPPPRASKNKKRSKDVKVKPILLNKDDPSCVSDSAPPSPSATSAANHFEQIHPKDEFELLHSGDKETSTKDLKEGKQSKAGKSKQVTKPETAKIEAVKTPQPEPPTPALAPEPPKEPRKNKNKANVAPVVEKQESIEKVQETVSVSSAMAISQPANLTTDKILKHAYPLETPTPPLITPTDSPAHLATSSASQQAIAPAKGKKKKSEMAQLQQLTMGGDGVNVNLLVRLLAEAPLSRSEIQILTDCLLNKQNGPLPEHSEWSEGPKDPLQKLKKQLAEKEKALAHEQDASLAVHAKLRELRASLNLERSRCTQLVQAADEVTGTHRLETTALHARLQRSTEDATLLQQTILQLQAKVSAEVEHTSQRSQMEMHIQTLSENKTTLTTALEALQAEMTQLRNSHSAVVNDLLIARDQIHASQRHTTELGRQLEEATQMCAEMDAQRLNAVRRSEQFAEQLMQANEKVQALNETQVEVQRLSSVNSRSQQQNLQHEKRQEELDRQNQQLSAELNKLKTERDELSHVITDMKEKLAAQPTPNGTTTPTDKIDTVSVEKAVAAACSELEAQHSHALHSLERQLDQHRDKNNDLRTKNWKVMEALQAAEKKIHEHDKSRAITPEAGVLTEAVLKASQEEQRATKEVLQRLFPQVSAAGETHAQWLSSFSEAASRLLHAPPASQDTQRVQDLEKQNTNLQTMLDKYKRVIDDTEGVLSRLQNNVTEEEQKWAKQLMEKQEELDTLKKHSVTQMQDKIDSLQETLETERKLRSSAECRDRSPFAPSVGKKAVPGMWDMEKLIEENSRLSELVERLQGAPQTLNGPSQLPPISTFERKASKKRRSIAGWFRRKITFRRKKSKESRAVDPERAGGDQREGSLSGRSSSSFPCASSKTL